MLSTLLLGAGCGENVLVGNLQLRSLSDAGAEIAEAIEADGGSTLPFRKADDAHEHFKDKSEKDRDNGHPEDKGGHN